MLTLATHDTKRSGDVRARLSLLAELPEAWEHAVDALGAAQRADTSGTAGRTATPSTCCTRRWSGPGPSTPRGRRRSWPRRSGRPRSTPPGPIPHPGYDEAVSAFVAAVLADREFVADLESFLAGHRLVELGRVSSLAQMTLLLTCPGIPDLYQGTEVWDLSLVDPDNRRPVDYAARGRLLDALAGAGPEAALARADEGGPKLWLIHRLLGHRRRCPDAYGPGSGYQPLPVSGARAGHVVAFTRTGGQAAPGLAVVVPRLVARLGGRTWDGTTVTLPGGDWINVLDGGAGARRPGERGHTAAAVSRRGPGQGQLMHEFRVWAPRPRPRRAGPRRAADPDGARRRRLVGVRGRWTDGGRARAPTTRSAWTAARRAPTRARPSSPTACTGRPGWSTTPPSAGTTAAGAGCRWPDRSSTNATSARSRPREPSTGRSRTWTTWPSSAWTPSS